MLRAMAVGQIPTYTWATKPAASALPSGSEIYISDVGSIPVKWFTNGTRWYPVGGRITLSSVCADASESTNSTSEIKTYGVLVPGGLLAVGCRITVEHEWTYPSSANTKTCRVRFGAANDLTGTIFGAPTATTTATAQYQTQFRIADSGVNAQLGYATATVSPFGNSSSAPATASVDTASDSYIVLSTQRTAGTETIVSKGYTIEVRYS